MIHAAEPQHDEHPLPHGSNRWLFSAAAFCAAFGLLLIVETHGAGDGTWFWYAEFFREGHRLYSGMHLALQPLFVLETSAWMALAGKGWLVGKVPAVLHLVAYVLALVLLLRYARLTDRQRAGALLCGFFVSISFEAYRFDDYHVLADCFQLYSILILLRIDRRRDGRTSLLLSAVLGLLSGLAITCRLNDGLALFTCVLIALVFLARKQRVAAALLFCAAAACTAAAVVACTGDTFHDYASYSILRAAASKGGAGSVLAYPLKLPVNALGWLWTHHGVSLFLLLTALAWGVLIAPLARPHAHRDKILAMLGLVLIVVFGSHTFPLLIDPRVLLALSAIAVVALYLFVLWTGARLAVPGLRDGRFGTWDRRQVLLLIPLGQLASGSISSGGSHISLYLPLVIFLYLFAVAPPFRLGTPWLRHAVTAALVVLFVSTAIVRIAVPYSWITYHEQPLFVGRTVFHHPQYGPMIIDRDLLQMIQPVCGQISSSHSDELLSLPYSYANYFCAIPPWRGYVQTFFDTTSAAAIDELMEQLENSPPGWIFYQRQLNSLALNEQVYNHGHPLEQRRLDDMIQRKIASKSWHVVNASDFGNTAKWDNHWFLIRTH